VMVVGWCGPFRPPRHPDYGLFAPHALGTSAFEHFAVLLLAHALPALFDQGSHDAPQANGVDQ